MSVVPPFDRSIASLSPSPIVSVAPSVVVSGLQDLEFVLVGSINEPVLVVDPAGPVSGQFALQGLGFSNAAERISLDLADQARDPAGHLAIGREPEQEVLPLIGVEVDAPHSSPPAISRNSSTDLVIVEPPFLSRATASISRLAFSGERNR